MSLPETKVLEKLNVVSTAKRLANMVSPTSAINVDETDQVQELHDSDFGKREEIHKIKNAKRDQ